MCRRLFIIFTLAAVAGIVIVTFNPVNARLQRLGLICSLVGIWLGPLILLWRHQKVRWVLLTIPVLLAVPLLLPVRPTDPVEVRADYLRRMKSLVGTPYFWGGESSRGIDCSGLPRKALRDALLSHGFKHWNGGAIRMFLGQWWFDASAKALGAGYRQYTIPLAQSGTIHDMSYQNLSPGDLAVTKDGVHILAYLGDDHWIQADPGVGSVVVLNGHTADNSWFQVPVTLHRWSVLSANQP